MKNLIGLVVVCLTLAGCSNYPSCYSWETVDACKERLGIIAQKELLADTEAKLRSAQRLAKDSATEAEAKATADATEQVRQGKLHHCDPGDRWIAEGGHCRGAFDIDGTLPKETQFRWLYADGKWTCFHPPGTVCPAREKSVGDTY